MAIGYFLRVGDKTTCGGQILTGDNTFIFHGRSAARQGDLVTCGKHSGTYNILGGVSNVWGNGRMMAGTLDSLSSCPCKARLINSITDCHSKEDEPAKARSFVETEQKQLITTPKPPSTVNNVFSNNLNIPVITNPNPINDSLIEDPVKIYVMINNEWIGHVGLVIGEGEGSLLYDPAGSYTGCYKRQCEDGVTIHRGSGEFFEYPNYDWNDYLAYQRDDGEDIAIIEFVIPEKQAEHLRNLVFEYGGAGIMECAKRIYTVLHESGGIFSELKEPFWLRSPWELKKQLLDIYYPSRGGVISGAY